MLSNIRGMLWLESRPGPSELLKALPVADFTCLQMAMPTPIAGVYFFHWWDNSMEGRATRGHRVQEFIRTSGEVDSILL